MNVEYMLLLALGLLCPSSQMIALLTAALTISLVEPIAHLYFFSPADAVLSLRYLLLLPPSRLVTYAAVVVVYVIGSAVSLRLLLGRRRGPFAKKAATTLMLCAVLLTAYDAAERRLSRSQTKSLLGDLDVLNLHVVRVPTISLIWELCIGFFSNTDNLAKKLPSALSRGLAESDPHTRPNVVLVLTESWGLAYDDQLNFALIERYFGPEVEARYSVEKGTVSFLGATTGGETRELCGDSRGHTTFAPPTDYVAACWPARLAAAGYKTLAVHGFTPSMFDRDVWYQQMGFASSAFLPQLQHDGASECDGAFPGACDADVALWIRNRLLAASDRPTFVHWVTLNSHLPLRVDLKAESSPPCMTLHISNEGSFCTWFSRIQLVHESVVKLAMTPQLRPTIFVIVGDHAPPFVNLSNRGRFSQTVVPYVILSPREISSTNMQPAKHNDIPKTAKRNIPSHP